MSEEAKQVAPLAVQRDVTIANAKQIGEPAVAATSRAGGNERHSEPLAPQLRSIRVGGARQRAPERAGVAFSICPEQQRMRCRKNVAWRVG